MKKILHKARGRKAHHPRCMAEWYRVVPEYSRWIMALTLPKMLAYIRATRKRHNRHSVN